MRARKGTTLVLVLAIGLVAAACGNSGDEETEGETTTVDGETEGGTTTVDGETEGGTITVDGESANDHGTKDVSGESELELELDDFYFEPTVLTGSAGQEITLELKNEGSVEHNFSLPDQTIDQDVEAEESAQVTVTFPDSGTLVFFCTYHQSMGMRGALQVE